MANYVKSTNFASKDSLAVGNPLKIVKGTELDTEFNNIATAVNTKADINSPALTGNPTAPTPSSGNNTTLIATTAFVTAAVSDGIVAERSATATLSNKTLASPTLTGTPVAPTASLGTNTTQLATTAFVQAALQAVYPVGSIYINASSATNPSSLLGFGTWVEFGAGRVLVGQNASDALFDTLEETGGSKDSILVDHSHTFSATTSGQSADHTHVGNNTTEFGIGTPFSSGHASNQGVNSNGRRFVSNGTSNDHTHTVSGSTSSAGSSGTNANVQPYIVVKMWKRTA